MTPAPEKAAPIPAEERLWWFLFVLNACGNHGSYANDEPGEWVAAFCDDVEPTDTFNRACDLKLATCTHNSMDETSRIWITEAGKRFLADRALQEERIRELEAEIERMTPKFVAYEYLVSPAGEEIALEENARLRDRIAALEAEASEGERRGLEPTDAMVACFSDPMLNPEWVRSRLRGALALIPAPAREGWQLIETAPRDGTPVLVWNGFCGVYVSRFFGGEWAHAQAHYSAVTGFHPALYFPVPSHWRPLPPPPQDREEQ